MSAAVNLNILSVNVKWVEKWNTNDFLQWIKVLQQTGAFEGKRTTQFNIMNKSINSSRLSGHHLTNCDTTQSFMKLFQHQINNKTANVLQTSLNIERTMFHRQQLSKVIIKSGKWKPKSGEKIRAIDNRYKGDRSYLATIKKAEFSQTQSRIFVCYAGYPDSNGEWISRDEWPDRITILEDNSNQSPSSIAKPLSQSKTHKSKTKRIKNWSTKDLSDWVKSIGLESKWQDIMTQAITSTGCTGNDWIVIEKYRDLAKLLDIKQTMLANRVFREFKKVKQAQPAEPQDNNNEIPSYTNIQSQPKIVFAWQRKHINTWTCNELQEWICSLNLQKLIEKKVVEAIVEQDITGEDFNSLMEVDEVQDSFEIKQYSAKKIYIAMETVRKYKPKSMDNYNQGNVKKHKLVIPNSGIIGLNNLGNTCFINCVIQSILQTPFLINLFRTCISSSDGQNNDAFGWNSWLTGQPDSSRCLCMLDAFIEVARAVCKENSKRKSISPTTIVKFLRDSDVKFAYSEQGDALSVVSKMLELLDKDIIVKEKKRGNIKGAKRHSGSWYIEYKGLDFVDEEEEIIEGNLMLYNPYQSVIREYIHFVERNMFTCMKCGYKEARYDIKEKILLPLKKYFTKIYVDIYIPSIKSNGAVLSKCECVILDYCAIQTLRYQIFDQVRTTANVKFDMKSVDQISIYVIKADKRKFVSGWIEKCDEKDDCSTLTRHGSIFAVIRSRKTNSITVTTFNVLFDKKGSVDARASYLELEEMKDGERKSFENVPEDKDYPKKYRNIFFGERVYDYDYVCRITHQHATIVVIWTHAGARKRYKWMKPDITNVDPICQCDIWNECNGNISNYSDCVEFIRDKIRAASAYAKTLDIKARAAFQKQWIETSLNFALATYEGLKSDQNNVIELVYDAFAEKKGFKRNSIVEDINDGFKTYCSRRVLDRGAVLKCRGKCKKKCEVFTQETSIVRFPEVLIFAIDRYINNSIFKDVIGYEEFETFDKQKYELYAVCNHSGTTNNYGHYWAYVKGYDDNQWYNANDSSISKINGRNVVDKETAILLFYKKKRK